MISMKLMYRNIANPDKTYEDVSEFFENSNVGIDDVEALKSHIANNNTYQFSKETTLLQDMQTVIMTIEFETEELANKWLEARAKLPTIDKNLKEERMFF